MFPCSAELISTAYQPWNSVFLSQQNSHSRLISQKNSLPNRAVVMECSTRETGCWHRRSNASNPLIIRVSTTCFAQIGNKWGPRSRQGIQPPCTMAPCSLELISFLTIEQCFSLITNQHQHQQKPFFQPAEEKII
jgi:hypothetical protein